MRYWVSFVDGPPSGEERVVDVCIVDAESKPAALASARAVCRRTARARIVLIPGHIALDAGDLGRSIPLDQFHVLSRRIEEQLAAFKRSGR